MTNRWLVPCAAVVLLVVVTHADTPPDPIGEKPTKRGIVALSTQCKQLGVRMDLVGQFGTDFSGLDLRGVDFRGAHAVRLETNLRRADFSNTNLQGAQFGAAILDGADFTGADLTDASFVTASLRDVTLRDVNVARTRFYQSDLSHANMVGIDLSKSDITGSAFRGADLSGSILAGAKSEYRWLDFSHADLRNADLHGLMLAGANFQYANLRSANLSGCQLEQADFTGADLQGADLEDAQIPAAVFRHVRGLSNADKQQLTRSARRWEFDLKTGVAAFLDSLAFPFCLLLVIPLVAVVTGVVRQQLKRKRPNAPGRLQFSLSSMLLWTAGICGFIGVGLWSHTGAFSYAMVCAFYLMVAELFSGRGNRKLAAAVLATALIYAALNVAVFCVLIMLDPFSTFDLVFMLAAVFVGPLLALAGAIAAAIIIFAGGTRFARLSLAGFVIWMVGVGFANLWVIVQASASV
jgi:uncharacterized protein YjbI with pentapeptide repeats